MTGYDVPTEEEVREAQRSIQSLRTLLTSRILGQERVIDELLVGLVGNGHVLIEGLPGLGKTELVKTLAHAVGLSFKRIQFTPDLLPSDIIGTALLHPDRQSGVFSFQPGPVFANLVLADEINRASPKTQAALLEAMQERSVTVLGETHRLPHPFFVVATQNPIELEGTYPLPEAQLDRFLVKVEVFRVDQSTLERILSTPQQSLAHPPENLMPVSALAELLRLAARIFVPEPVVRYMARIVDATHVAVTPQLRLRFGASPRAALALAAAARARALCEGRRYVSFEDVATVAAPVLRHRLILDYESRLQGFSTKEALDAVLARVRPLEKLLPPFVADEV